MESEENIKPFPSLPTVRGNPAENAGLPHSHRTATTMNLDSSTLFPLRQINFAATRYISAG